MIFLFHGLDTYQLNKKLLFWQEEFAKKHDGDTNITILNGKETDTNEILQQTETMPFLAEKRLVIIKNLLNKAKSDEQKKLSKHLEEIPDFCVLVFAEDNEPDRRLTLYKKLKKIATIEEFKPLEGYQLTQWIQNEIQQKDGKISAENARYLGYVCGNNLWQLSNELNKLIAYSENKEITPQIIDLLVRPELHTTIFKLTDAIGLKNTKGSIKILNDLVESGEDPKRIFYMIVRQFRILIQTLSLLQQNTDQREITRILKQHPFTIKTAIDQCRNFNMEMLKKIYQSLLEIDTRLKTGKIRITPEDQREFLLSLEQLILESC